jgi:hypothetical protein
LSTSRTGGWPRSAADSGYILELGRVVYAGDAAGLRKQAEWPIGAAVTRTGGTGA